MSIRKILKYIFRNTIYLLTYLIPKKNNIFLFGAWNGQKYNDNSKYLYEYYVQNKSHKQNIYWMTKNKKIFEFLKNKNMPVIMSNSVKGVWIILRAKYIFMTNGFGDVSYSFLINNNTFKIQLWHGLGNKKILCSANYEKWKKQEEFNKKFNPADHFLRFNLLSVTSELMKKRYSEAFCMNANKVQVLGMPRLDILYKNINVPPTKVILYAPTHRKHGKNKIIKEKILTDYNLKQINNFCIENNFVFKIKLHPIDEKSINLEKFKKYENIIIIEDNPLFDIQKELLNTSILITDYSSIYLDFLLIDRPIIFFCFDIEEYEKNDQGGYKPFKNEICGPLLKNWDEILIYIYNDIHNYKKNFLKKRKSLIKKYFDNNWTPTCKKIKNYIERLEI